MLDGYVRYREPDERSESDACGYVAALFPDRSVACEWEWLGERRLPNVTIPSLVEFSTVRRDSHDRRKPTGLLPDEDLPVLAIGIAPREISRIQGLLMQRAEIDPHRGGRRPMVAVAGEQARRGADGENHDQPDQSGVHDQVRDSAALRNLAEVEILFVA